MRERSSDALYSPPAVVRFALVAIAGLVLDLWTKHLAFTKLTPDTTSASDPTFSPDGSRIAYVSLKDGNPEIYVTNADGTGATRITNEPQADGHPAFTPGREFLSDERQRDREHDRAADPLDRPRDVEEGRIRRQRRHERGHREDHEPDRE